jgi:hypothetical protein
MIFPAVHSMLQDYRSEVSYGHTLCDVLALPVAGATG